MERETPNGQRKEIDPESDDARHGNSATNDESIIQYNPTAKQHFKTVYDDITDCKTLKQLQGAWERHQPVIKVLPVSMRGDLEDRKNQMKDLLSESTAAAKAGEKPIVSYNFNNLDPAH